jgi:hypothetical protein
MIKMGTHTVHMQKTLSYIRLIREILSQAKPFALVAAAITARLRKGWEKKS